MNTLRNFFERMKEKFSGEEFHYAEKELMHFLGKVERTLEILEIWFGNFNSPNQDVTELKEYYDNMRGEFNQNVLENVDNLTNALYEMENYIFNHPDDIKPGGAFIKLLFDIENMDKDNPDYTLKQLLNTNLPPGLYWPYEFVEGESLIAELKKDDLQISEFEEYYI